MRTRRKSATVSIAFRLLKRLVEHLLRRSLRRRQRPVSIAFRLLKRLVAGLDSRDGLEEEGQVSIAFRLLKRLVARSPRPSVGGGGRSLNCLSAVEAIGRRTEAPARETSGTPRVSIAFRLLKRLVARSVTDLQLLPSGPVSIAFRLLKRLVVEDSKDACESRYGESQLPFGC